MACCKCCCEYKTNPGKCCGPEGAKTCCEPPDECCGEDCCGTGYHCCGGVNCCEEHLACCGESCCDAGECCEDGVCVSCDCDPACSEESCEQCVDGECVSTCSEGQTCCGGTCTDSCCCCTEIAITSDSPCPGTLLEGLGSGCAGASITIAWCGVELTYDPSQGQVGNGVIASNTDCPASPVCTLVSLEVEGFGTNLQYYGFYDGCGDHCFFRAQVAVAQYPEEWSPCFNAPRRGRVIFREGCDAEAMFALTEEGTLCDCDEAAPTVTVSFAP